MALYLPVAVGGMLIYGESVAPNIALTLGESWLVDVANLFMACHLILAFLIVTNPVSQELEHILNLPHGLLLINFFYLS
jgi:solute carrier family 32 (vesicular inhibitory amino acid transporter)